MAWSGWRRSGCSLRNLQSPRRSRILKRSGVNGCWSGTDAGCGRSATESYPCPLPSQGLPRCNTPGPALTHWERGKPPRSGRGRCPASPPVCCRIRFLAFPCCRRKQPVQVEDAQRGVLIESLRRGAPDLGIGWLGGPAEMQRRCFAQLRTEQVICVVAAGHWVEGTSDPA